MSNDTPRLTCSDLVMGASEYLDGELQPSRHRLFEEHQEQCSGCHGTVTSLRRTIEGIRSLSHDTAPPRLKELLSETMQRVNKNRT